VGVFPIGDQPGGNHVETSVLKCSNVLQVSLGICRTLELSKLLVGEWPEIPQCLFAEVCSASDYWNRVMDIREVKR